MEVVRARRTAYVVGLVDEAHDVRVVGADDRLPLRGAAVGHDQRDVAVLECGEVGDEGVEVVGALDQHEAALRPPRAGTVGDAALEVGVAERAVACEHGGCVAEAGMVEDGRRAGGAVRREGHGATGR